MEISLEPIQPNKEVQEFIKKKDCRCHVDKLGIAHEVEMLFMNGASQTQIAREMTKKTGELVERRHIMFHLHSTGFFDFVEKIRKESWKSIADQLLPQVEEQIAKHEFKLPSADKILEIAFAKSDSVKLEKMKAAVLKVFAEFALFNTNLWIDALKDKIATEIELQQIGELVKPKMDMYFNNCVKQLENIEKELI